MRRDANFVSFVKGGKMITLFKCWNLSTGCTLFVFFEHPQFRRRQYYTKWRVHHPFTSGTKR